MKEKSLFQFDILILLSVICLVIIGILFIYSSGISSTGVLVTNEYIKQIIWAISGFLLLFVTMNISLTRFQSWSSYIYFFLILLLMITLIFGKTVNGAKSWIGIGGLGIQPSELMKIAAILMLGKYYESNIEKIKSLWVFLLSLVIVIVPMGLILLQPDLGTAMVYIPIFITMAFIVGVKKRYLVFFILTGLGIIILSFLPVWQHYILSRDFTVVHLLTDRLPVMYILLSLLVITAIAAFGLFYIKRQYFLWIIYGSSISFLSFLGSFAVRAVIKEYQIQRMIIFLDPTIDPRGAGWHIIQSLTAIGSGGFSGKGFLKGTQSHYRYLPQQSTDFIFSILAEEWGFLGGVLILALFTVLLLRGLKIVANTKNVYTLSVGAGIIAMLAFHMMINIGMVMGLMPITGLPLMFVSYGGSSLWAAFIGVGLILNIHKERFNY